MTVLQKAGTVVPHADGGYLVTFLDRTERVYDEDDTPIFKAKMYIEHHQKAIEVNQATLKHIDAQRLARAEAERLKLSPDQERLWGLVDKWKYFHERTISIGPNHHLVIHGRGSVYKSESEFRVYNFLTPADDSDFPQEIRKPLLDKLCEVHQKTPGQLADWIEEQRRPKPKYEILSTDVFWGDTDDNVSVFVVREGREALLVDCDGEKWTNEHWEDHSPQGMGCLSHIAFDEGIRRMRQAGWDVQVKQVEPPKPQWPMVKMGDKVKHRTSGVFIVAQVDTHKAALIGPDGNRWSRPADMAEIGTREYSLEDLVTPYNKVLGDWTKLTT